MSFGERLRAAREARGYTQQQVADHMGISKSTYCGYETGKRQPDVQKIKQLSNFLGVSGDELLETGYPTSSKRPISDDDIMFALWGDTNEVDQDDLDDVKRYAAFIQERKKKK